MNIFSIQRVQLTQSELMQIIIQRLIADGQCAPLTAGMKYASDPIQAKGDIIELSFTQVVMTDEEMQAYAGMVAADDEAPEELAAVPEIEEYSNALDGAEDQAEAMKAAIHG